MSLAAQGFEFHRLHKLVLLVVATTGEGDATDNAKSFNKYITSKSTGVDVFSGLKYAVFGLGDLNYISFNHMGKRTEKHMDRLGAVKVYPRGIGDASQDIEADLRRWIDGGLIETIKDSLPNLRRTGSKPVMVLEGIPDMLEMIYVVDESFSAGKSRGRDTLSKVFWGLRSAEVVSNEELRQKPSAMESTREICLRFDDEYVACDSVEVLPRNSPEVVQWLAREFGVEDSLDKQIDFVPKNGKIENVRKLPFPTPCTLRFALEQYVDVSSGLSKTFLSNLATLCRENAPFEDAVSEMISSGVTSLGQGGLNLVSFLQIFRPAFGLELSISDFLQIAQKQKLRPYTGAAGTSESGTKLVVALTAGACKPSCVPELVATGLLPSDTHLGPAPCEYFGLCSEFLKNLNPGDSLLYRIRPSVLRTEKKSVPPVLLAIVTGAGLAPFMAIMDSEDSFNSEVHLVFGCRDPDADFLYKSTILSWQASGRIHCYFAFSQRDRKYVQDVVKEERTLHKVITEIHTNEGRILVCGRTSMGRAVCEVIASQVGGQAELELLEQRGALTVEYFG